MNSSEKTNPIQPTMKSIALAAGVSESTVSRALNNHPKLKDETKRRVNEVAESLGYRRNPYVTALMSQVRLGRPVLDKPAIALIHCMDLKRYDPIHPVLVDFEKGASEQAERLGYRLEAHYLKKRGGSPERLLNVLLNRGIKGVIFEHPSASDFPEAIDLSPFASVSTEFMDGLPYIHKVSVDVYENVLKAVARCSEEGYRRFGLLLSGYQDERNHYRRRAAFRMASEKIVPDGHFSILEGEDSWVEPSALNRWIRENELEVVITPMNRDGNPVLESGLTVPDDVAFVGLDLWEGNANGFAGIEPGWLEMGKIAVNLVVDEIGRNEFGIPKTPIRSVISGNWVDGRSLPSRAVVGMDGLRDGET